MCTRASNPALLGGPSTLPLAAMVRRAILSGLAVILTVAAGPVSTTKSQCEQLVQSVLERATNQLARSDYAPFGAWLTPEGKVEFSGAYDTQHHPPWDSLIELIRTGLRNTATMGPIVADAVVFSARGVPPGGTQAIDVLEIELEHRDNYCVILSYPYVIDGAAVTFRKPFAQKGKFLIFGAHGS